MQPIEIKMGDVRAVITLLTDAAEQGSVRFRRKSYRVEVWRESMGRANSVTQVYGEKMGCFSWVVSWAEATADASN